MMKSKQNRRKLRNYLIKKDIQLKIIFINIFYIFFVTLITFFVILSPVISAMYQSYDSEVQFHAARFFLVVAEKLPLAIGIVLVLASIHQILITHQVCGPLVNFSNTFKKILQGDLTRKIHLRYNDFLTEEGNDINKMIDYLSRLLGNIKEDNHKLLCALNEVTIKPGSTDEQQKSEKALGTARKQVQVINEHLSIFKFTVNNKEEQG